MVNSGVLSEVAGTGGWPELGGVDLPLGFASASLWSSEASKGKACLIFRPRIRVSPSGDFKIESRMFGESAIGTRPKSGLKSR